MTGNFIFKKLFNKNKDQFVYDLKREIAKRKIKNRNFTIISNNCWGGRCYQYLDMPYLSPTVGLYFFADDYLKFIKNLRYYFSLDLKFIDVSESKYREELIRRGYSKPIGILDDVEIMFLHYKDENEAYEKWNRRLKRVNYNNIILKFSRQNLCEDKHIEEFASIKFKNKFVINNRKKPKYSFEYYWKGKLRDESVLDTDDFPGNIRVNFVIRNKFTSYPDSLLPE